MATKVDSLSKEVDMPSRPRSHQLEDESKRQFASILPSAWVFRGANPDYGIDGQIEVFDRNNKATGLMFLVQLKGTDEAHLKDALAIQFKLDTLTYYRKLDLPVMIVLYHSQTGHFSWRWAHEVDTFFAERGQEYITVRMPNDAAWLPDTPSLIEKDLTEFREVRSPGIRLPQTFSVVTAENGFHGTPRATLEAALIEAAQDISDVVRLSSENENVAGAHPAIVIDNARFVVSLSGLTSLTFHTESYPAEFATTKLPHDILTTIGVVLGRAGHHNLAAQIACKHLDKSSLLETPEIFFQVLRAIAKGRCLTDGLRLAEALLKSESLSLAQMLIVPALMSGGAPLSASEIEYLRSLMKQIIERHKADGRKEEAATAHYNLGNHLRAQRGLHDRGALKQYCLAARCDPVYRQRHYFWREAGGILFGLARFAFSARAYDKAIRLGGEKECMALRADALMFAGRYAEAHQLFQDYLRTDVDAEDAEWRLKSFALVAIIKSLGLEKQKRDQASAIRVANVVALSPTDAEASLNEALQFDALCALAWFNLAVNAHRQKKPDDALLGFVMAGLIGRTDPESWANALLLSLRPEKLSLLVEIALVGYKINGQRFMDALRKLAEKQHQSFPSATLLDQVWKLVTSVERPTKGFEVRMLGKGSSYESIQLEPDLTPTARHVGQSSQSKPPDNMQPND